MASSTLRDNGTYWDGYSLETAKDFLWQEAVGANHPSRKAAQEGMWKNFHPAKTLLEVPCASGAEYEALAKRYDVTCMDRTEVMLKALKTRYPNVKTIKGDIRDIPKENASFDIVYARAIFEHLPSIGDVADAMRECVRIAKLGAVFSFFIPPTTEERIDWNGNYFNNTYALKDIEKAIKSTCMKSFTKEDISVYGTGFLDDATIFYVKK